MVNRKDRIEYIPVENLWPHPDNPRRDLGDLSELAESIKVNGVLQNLTVVPRLGEITGQPTGDYTVVIGHRRLAAAKLAGLETVPCIVSGMTGIEQVRTMLTENMQRTDLTPYEQAQGFQLMLDWGDTVDEIAERTGFSKGTVRRRVKLLELDKKKFEKAEKRGATLMDFAELEKIRDIDVRNEVLDRFGTYNWRISLQRALDDQAWEDRRAAFLEKIKTFAEEDPAADSQRKKYIRNYGPWTRGFVVVPDDADTVKYYYKVSKVQIDIFTDRTQSEKEEEEAQWAEQNAIRMEAERVEGLFRSRSALHYNLRKAFVKNLTCIECGKALPLVSGFLADLLWEMTDTPFRQPYFDLDELLTTLYDYRSSYVEDKNEEEGKIPTDFAGVREAMEHPEKLVFCAAWCTADHDELGYWLKSWEPKLQRYIYTPWENKRLDRIYRLLEALGYEMSDDEKAMQDGTHEIFKEFGEKG